jgi:hypothetical protein
MIIDYMINCLLWLQNKLMGLGSHFDNRFFDNIANKIQDLRIILYRRFYND